MWKDVMSVIESHCCWVQFDLQFPEKISCSQIMTKAPNLRLISFNLAATNMPEWSSWFSFSYILYDNLIRLYSFQTPSTCACAKNLNKEYMSFKATWVFFPIHLFYGKEMLFLETRGFFFFRVKWPYLSWWNILVIFKYIFVAKQHVFFRKKKEHENDIEGLSFCAAYLREG